MWSILTGVTAAMGIYFRTATSRLCQEDRYLKELVRYIHLNLFRAGLVKDILELNQSPWSGHSALMGKVKREWQNSEYVLSFFGIRKIGYQYRQSSLQNPLCFPDTICSTFSQLTQSYIYDNSISTTTIFTTLF